MSHIKLRDIASARAGDKGNISNISVWAYEPADYPLIKRELTSKRVKDAYPDLFKGVVTRYELDGLCGLNFVIEQGLEGGVNSSLNLDAHGKSFSFLLLDLDITLPEERRPVSVAGASKTS
jgi:hypothetical protein